MTHAGLAVDRYRPLTAKTIAKSPYWDLLDPELQQATMVVSTVLPFRVNEYILRELIDWDRVPDDPIFQLTFPQRDMLDPADYHYMQGVLARGASRERVVAAANSIRMRLNPQPAGQVTHNVPTLNGRPLSGIQHKYRETVLFFPARGQTCHAYCTYCFRWAQFVELPDLKFEARESEDLVAYLKVHPEVTDVLVTGGDPLIMRTRLLRQYIEPLLSDELSHVRHIRLGTKSPAYWPQRFVSDDDADDLLRLFEQVVQSGRHMALMAHYSHPRELKSEVAREAVRRIRDTGAEVRVQAPLVRCVNDDADSWADLWQTAVGQGAVPYYMFVERDTGPKRYFEVPLARAYEVFRDAYQQVSGLARTVRGPSMSAFPGKVRVVGIAEVVGQKVFVLDFIQAREPGWVRRPFFARFDPDATWLDDLEPAFGERFFFEEKSSIVPFRRHWRAGLGAMG